MGVAQALGTDPDSRVAVEGFRPELPRSVNKLLHSRRTTKRSVEIDESARLGEQEDRQSHGVSGYVDLHVHLERKEHPEGLASRTKAQSKHPISATREVGARSAAGTVARAYEFFGVQILNLLIDSATSDQVY